MQRVQKAQYLAWRSAVLLSAIAVVCSAGCKGDGVPALVYVDASGGPASSGSIDRAGGSGGSVDASVSYGTGATIEILSEGKAQTTTSIQIPFVELGPVPVVIDEDLELWILGPGEILPATSLYLEAGSDELRISDGDANHNDDEVATGIEVVRGATLTLPLNLGDAGGLSFSHDVVNDGVVTVLDVDDARRGGVSLVTLRNYLADGQVLTHGTEPGQSGGDVEIRAGGVLVSEGAIRTHGAASDAGDGGDGGSIVLAAESVAGDGWVANLGLLSSEGGVSRGPASQGGTGADIEIAADQRITNTGHVDASGGDGTAGGGVGGRVWLRVLAGGNLTNTASVASRGGDSTDGAGAAGGRISFEAHGGEIRSSGALDASGGRSTASPTADGGRGGRVDCETHDLADPGDPRAGDVWLSGRVDVSGGVARSDRVARGGAGGSVSVAILNEHGSVGQSVHLLGYDGLDAAGADAARVGGDGGSVTLTAGADDASPEGLVEIEPGVDVSGGDSDPQRLASAGGDGGDVSLSAASAARGRIDVGGGTGNVAGAPGTITEP